MQLVTQLVTRVPLHGPKTLVKKMVSLDLSLQRHLTGPLESSLQHVFRSLLKHQWETNYKLRLLRFRARASSFTGPLSKDVPLILAAQK